MYKNQASQFVDVQLIVRADGTDATGLTPTVRVKKDGGTFANGAGVIKEFENGGYEYSPTQAETNCDHLVVQVTSATVITTIVNIYPIDVALYKTDTSGLSTFDAATDQVITDAASRTASQADVSNLDVAVSTRMATTHIAATAGKVDGVATTDNCTNNGDMRGTDAAATAAEMANVPKKGAQTWTHSNGEVAGVNVAQP